MRFMITGRQMGKTHRMIKWLRQNPHAVAVVHSKNEADRLDREYPDVADRIVLYRHLGTVLRSGNHNQIVGIDNLDLILHRVLELPPMTEIKFITATGESDNG